ncbi:MAG: hypothetical protein M3160_02035 [Candidatus Eremiobacteraeota bacterium]|nr:hypothetical protein [Candidatus Eremiobacteraeota bacterium]
MFKPVILILAAALLGSPLKAVAQSASPSPAAGPALIVPSPSAGTTPVPPSFYGSDLTAGMLPVGTPISIRFINCCVTNPGKMSRAKIVFQVLEDVKVNGTLIIPKGRMGFAHYAPTSTCSDVVGVVLDPMHVGFHGRQLVPLAASIPTAGTAGSEVMPVEVRGVNLCGEFGTGNDKQSSHTLFTSGLPSTPPAKP